MAAIKMTIKNTFVHAVMGEGCTRPATAERRCSSEPPSARFANMLYDTYEGLDKEGRSTPAPSCTEDSTNADMSERASSVFNEDEICDDTPRHEVRSGVDPTQAAGDGSSLLVLTMLSTMTSFGEAIVPPCPAEEPRKQRLNSKAQAWTPCTSAHGAPQTTVGFLAKQIAGIIAVVAGTLQQGFTAAAVQVSDSPAGWCITVHLPLVDFQEQREKVLGLACQALLAASRSCSGSGHHLLGSLAMPFVTTPFGCSAMLGGVANQGQACWDSLARGFCHRGHGCRWEHPTCRTAVNVMVKIAEQ